MHERQDEPAATEADGALATFPGAAAALRRFERRSTASLVSETLRDSIIRGELPPGTPLREQALAQGLDVSRNTVREALRLLSHEGLVDYHVHRGVAVRKLSSADVRDLFLTREALEVTAIHSSRTAPREQLQAIDRVVGDAERAAEIEDWKEVATLDILFHQQIVQLIGSERIAIFFRRLGAELRLVFTATLRPSEHGPYVPWNRKLIDLLVAGEVDACAAEMRAYLAAAEEMIQSALARSG
jgi:DNA-binding GntR family transcriptional regulator